MYYVRAGARRPRAIFVGGTGCNERLWGNVKTYLPRSDLLVPFFLKPKDTLNADTLSHHINRECKSSDNGPLHLLGFSRGAHVVLEYVNKKPDDVASIVLINGDAGGNRQASSQQKFLDTLQSGTFDPCDPEYLTNFVNTNAENFQDTIRIMQEMLQEMGPEQLIKQVEALANRPHRLPTDKTQDIKTLVIGSDCDRIVKEESIDAVASAWQAEKHMLSGSGHMSPLEVPEQLGMCLHRWFLRVFCEKNQPKYQKDVVQGKLPSAGATGGYLTAEGTGLDPYSERFVNNMGTTENGSRTLLDVGSGYGQVTKALLGAGHTVIANDLNPYNLHHIWKTAPVIKKRNLWFLCGDVMEYQEVPFQLDGIVANRVLHFFNGETITKFVKWLPRVLKQGGYFSATVASPSMRLFEPVRDIYSQRKKSGEPYPGWIEVGKYIDAEYSGDLPQHMHLFKVEDLQQLFAEQDELCVEEVGTFDRKEDPECFQGNGGRVGILARRR